MWILSNWALEMWLMWLRSWIFIFMNFNSWKHKFQWFLEPVAPVSAQLWRVLASIPGEVPWPMETVWWGKWRAWYFREKNEDINEMVEGRPGEDTSQGKDWGPWKGFGTLAGKMSHWGSSLGLASWGMQDHCSWSPAASCVPRTWVTTWAWDLGWGCDSETEKFSDGNWAGSLGLSDSCLWEATLPFRSPRGYCLSRNHRKLLAPMS